MKNPLKIQERFRLRDEVNQTRGVNMHWDSNVLVEMVCVRHIDAVNNLNQHMDGDNDYSVAPATPTTAEIPALLSDYDYDVWSLFDVRPEERNYPITFWVGQVVEVHMNGNKIHKIIVYRFEFYCAPGQSIGIHRHILLPNGTERRPMD